ncbi:MAG: peptide ABC transporter substrate-binding protein [Cellvibrionaceae bacterium]
MAFIHSQSLSHYFLRLRSSRTTHFCSNLNFFHLITLLLFVFSFPTFSTPPPDAKLAKEQVFHRGNGTEPHSLDPHIAEGVPSSNIHRDLFQGLIGETPSGDLIPGVASSWEISEDGREYIFHIRPTAKWSNGDPVTAEDFVYSWRRVVDPITASNYSQMLAPMNNAGKIIKGELPTTQLGVSAINEKTLRVNLHSPTPFFLGILTHSIAYPIHPNSLKKHGDKHTRPGNLVSNGAYMLDEWEIQSHVKLVRNKHYWDNENTTIDAVYFYPTEDLNAEVLRYRAGELDFTYQLPVSQIDRLKETLPNELHIVPYLGIYYYGLNLTQPPFKDSPVELRQALSMAIDREILTDKVLKDGSLPAYGWVPPGTLGYQSKEYPWKALSQKDRHQKAKELYKKAGYSDKNPFRVEIRYNTHQNHKKVALAIAAMWKKNLGVIATIINQEWKVYIDVRQQKRVTQVFRSGWIADYNDPFSFIEMGLSYNEMNNTGYGELGFDNLVAQSIKAKSHDERASLLQQAEAFMLEDFPYIPIYYYTTKRLVKPHVGGYTNNIMDHLYSKDYYILEH